MNEQNLIPQNRRTKREQREIASKGGKKSGEARRDRKKLKEALLLLLAKGETQDNICLALIEKAQSGDTKAFEVIRDTIGEKPVDKLAYTDSEGNAPDVPVVSNAELLAIMERRHRMFEDENKK